VAYAVFLACACVKQGKVLALPDDLKGSACQFMFFEHDNEDRCRLLGALAHNIGVAMLRAGAVNETLLKNLEVVVNGGQLLLLFLPRLPVHVIFEASDLWEVVKVAVMDGYKGEEVRAPLSNTIPSIRPWSPHPFMEGIVQLPCMSCIARPSTSAFSGTIVMRRCIIRRAL
jgi:hypothetical protein